MIETDIKRQEGKQLKPYLDCCGQFWRLCTCAKKGILTIGYGRNLDEVGLTASEIDYLFQNDLGRVRHELDQALPWWREKPLVVQDVLTNLGFNLGVLTPPDTAKLLTFTQTINLIRADRFVDAADNLKRTLWHQQVGQRALDIEQQLRSAQPNA